MKRPNNWEELLEIAKRQPDLLGAMERVGIPLKRVGGSRRGGKRYQTTTKKLGEGDLSSVVFIENPDGSWIVFDNKQRTGKATLDAISTLREFGGVSFDDAVYLLSGGSPALPPSTPKKIQPKADVAADEPPKPFEAPPTYKEKTRNVIAYLTKTRCIPYELVKALIEGEKLYAGYWKKDMNDPDAKKVVKCVFKITDEEGKFVGADSLLPISDYKGKYMASGSDPAYAWNFAWGVDEITKDTPLFFCEAPLDAMSLCAITGASGVYISLSGTKDITFLSMIEKLGGTPIICTDHDGGAGDNFAKKYPQYRRMIPPVGKDWNDALKHYVAQGLPYALKPEPSENVPKKAKGAPTESAPQFEIISGVVDKALANKGNIGEKYNQKRISPVPSDIAQMISVASGGKIDVSQKHIAIHGDRVWHEYRQHSQIEKETGLNQIPLTAQSIKEAIAAIYDPDIIESVFADKDNPTERQSFVYAKKSSNGHYVVVETVGGKNNPNLTPVMILQFTETKLKSMLSTGKTFGELFFENDLEKFSALDVEYNKRNRVIVAQFASKEAIASTPHSPRSINSVPQNPPNVNPSDQNILKDEMAGAEALPKDEYLENLYKELELCELTIQNKDKLPPELVEDAHRIKKETEERIEDRKRVLRGELKEDLGTVAVESTVTETKENSPAPSDDLFNVLKQRVTSAVEGYRNNPQALAEFLAFSASFNNYSAKNLRLIWVQDPHASFVAPASFFKAGMPDENGVPRTQEKIYINKGEKALRIWKPYEVKYVAVPREGQPPELTEYAKLPKELKQRAEAEKWAVKTQVKFRLVPVFDIAQTTAPPEAYPKTFGFGGNVNRDAEQQYLAVKQYAEDVLGCPVSIADFGEQKATVRGFFRPDANEIVLSDMLSGDGKLSTLIHEVGHAELHGDMVSNRHKSTAQIELEADMYALMIEAKLGIQPTEARCRHLGAHYEAYMQELAAKLPEGQTLDLNADIDAMNNVLHRYTEQSPLIERYLDRQLSKEAQVATTSPENQQKAPKPTVTPRSPKI